MSAPDATNLSEYESAFDDPKELEGFLLRFLGLRGEDFGEAVRAVSTDSEPSKQLKNRLGQGSGICDAGLVHFRVADRASHDKLVDALENRWAKKPSWSKVGSVAVAYPGQDGPVIGSVVSWRAIPKIEKLKEMFPGARFIEASGSPAVTSEDASGNLPATTAGRNVWLEFSHRERDASGWGVGEALWSPTKAKGGADRYAPMREVKAGDLVLHAMGGTIAGFSIAQEGAAEVADGPVTERWTAPFYRVQLRDFRRLTRPVGLMELAQRFGAEIGAELDAEHPSYYPFCRYGDSLRTNQGMYLARITPRLYSLILKAGEKVAYSIEEALDGLFMSREHFEMMLSLLGSKKNLVLQGPPGVGKTFVARRVAFALMGERDETRLASVQFHQSYSYEDFIQGIRPAKGGGFERQDGLFVRFCDRARSDPHRPYVLVIDEMNRGNLSKILGEALALLEADKRGESLSLMYQEDGEPPFDVPENVHVLGLMNTADRSLAVVDYALRRRFAFVDLEPEFRSPAFRPALSAAGVPEALVDRIVTRLENLNRTIADDVRHLGPGFVVGHSFFCTFDGSEEPDDWYRKVVETEIGPLLREYWFDDPEKAKNQVAELLR